MCETIKEKEKVPLTKSYRAVCEITAKGKDFLEQIEHQLPYIIQEDVIPQVPYPIIKEGITKVVRIVPLDKGGLGGFVKLDLEILT